jgi:hypothetical protein
MTMVNLNSEDRAPARIARWAAYAPVCRSSSWVDAGRDDLIVVLSPWGCTNSGAEKPSKKTLVFAQNIENKGSEFFVPLDLWF